MFTPDGALEVEGGICARGRDALVDMCRGAGYGTVHTTTDATIVIDGDMATQECTLVLARRSLEPRQSVFALTGGYADEMVRTEQGWRFRRRHVTLDG